jgi:hypothetical protein
MVARQERATGVGVSVECTDAEGDWNAIRWDHISGGQSGAETCKVA